MPFLSRDITGVFRKHGLEKGKWPNEGYPPAILAIRIMLWGFKLSGLNQSRADSLLRRNISYSSTLKTRGVLFKYKSVPGIVNIF